MTSLLDARAAYFEANGFGEDGGYSKATVTVTVLGIPVQIPNTEGRKRAVVFHDMHHLITGYATTNLGEAEIGAWELGSGCWDYRAAWLLNSGSLLLGVFTSPSRLFRAFVRGRQSANLYGRDADALLRRPVDEVRNELGLTKALGPASVSDIGVFALHLVGALAAAGLPLLAITWLLLRLF
ncbi:MAG: hypothetical protein ACRBN8_23450 [Nannocystales bacterium]